MKKKLILFTLAIPIIILSLFFAEVISIPTNDLPINYMSGDYAYDIDNPREVVGFGDYVFIAQVNEEIGTEYKFVKELKNGTKFGLPFTIYSITVIDNCNRQRISA